MKLLGFAIIIGFCFISASAQTAKDLSAKYGSAHESYEIRPGIFLTVIFAADGRACEMFLEKRHVRTSGTIVIDVEPNFMSPEETKPIIEELVPSNQRGKQTSRGAFGSGSGVSTFEEYENVSISYYRKYVAGNEVTAAVVIHWKNR
ncbi:MAG TPA: hypothetical protein VHP99_06590 [Pyrinomonadaceae bacterium]|jgi:hypothetical protein|nr:hypothetical protein [Pyrinomonadaceae bacterium]